MQASFTELLITTARTKLNMPVALGESAIQVYSINGFDVNIPLLIGDFGNESAEIINTHSTTAPANKIISLNSAISKGHNQDTPVFVLIYDTVELSHADAEDGAKTIISSAIINPESEDYVIDDETYSDGYYFIRYQNSITTQFSDYSDPIPHDGLEPNTVGAVIYEVLEDLNCSLDEKLTHSMLLSALNRMMREVRGRLNKWSDYQKFDANLGVIQAGTVAYDLPDDIYTKSTNRSIKNVKVAGIKLRYIDKNEYDRINRQSFSSLIVQANPGNTSLRLDDAIDFTEAGVVTVFVGGERHKITYTSKGSGNNTLYGVPVSGDGSIPEALYVGSIVAQNETYADPQVYTIYNQQLQVPCLSRRIGMDIGIDYWTDIETVDSNMDTLAMPRYDMAFHYLKAYIRGQVENNGVVDRDDVDYIKYLEITATAIRREHTGQKRIMAPNINGITYR